MIAKVAPRFAREGRCVCKLCGRELDALLRLEQPPYFGDRPVKDDRLMVSRHLNRIEEYTSKGARPTGFCLGSFGEPNPVPMPTRRKR